MIDTKSEEPAAVWVRVSELTPWAQNPRHNDEAAKAVAKSIKRFGFGAPLIARRQNGEVIAGHTRLKAAILLGLETVPVRYLDLDPADAHLLALADNRLGEKADWDDKLLGEVMSDYSFEDVEIAGWSQAELEKMGGELLGGADDTKADETQTVCSQCGATT